MNRMKEIRSLEKEIQKINKKISQIIKECPHKRIRHYLFPDCYMGQGESKLCADCGKGFGCSTYPSGQIIKKTWIEKNK